MAKSDLQNQFDSVSQQVTNVTQEIAGIKNAVNELSGVKELLHELLAQKQHPNNHLADPSGSASGISTRSIRDHEPPDINDDPQIRQKQPNREVQLTQGD